MSHFKTFHGQSRGGMLVYNIILSMRLLFRRLTIDGAVGIPKPACGRNYKHIPTYIIVGGASCWQEYALHM